MSPKVDAEITKLRDFHRAKRDYLNGEMLKAGEAGMAVAEICRKHGISAATWYA
jgi:hypothetical protein